MFTANSDFKVFSGRFAFFKSYFYETAHTFLIQNRKRIFFKNAFFKIFRKYFTRTLFPKVEDFLAGLADRGYTLALVTGTPHDQVAHILPASVKSSFSCMVTGDTVRRGKPHDAAQSKSRIAVAHAAAQNKEREND